MKKNKKLIAGLALATSLFLGNNLYKEAFVGVEKKVKITNPNVKDKVKITHITDFHSNVLSNLEEVLANIEDFNPDLIFLTGDMIDYPTEKKIERTMYFLEKLSKLKIKTYFVSGNHEEVSNKSEKFYDKLKTLSIKKLDNDGEFIKIGDNRVYVYGVSYWQASLDKFKPDDSLNLVLSHFSKSIRDNYNKEIDLVFSGHTHGGQVRAPFIGAFVAPGEGYLPDYDSGLYTYRDSQIYVSSGLGNTFLPLRFLDPVSYSNITIVRP
ncbi:metallophosphoesterase [uncultured Anaerococcus sp.]|uniref:metallophosphoesterase n=1 Tax=uncultured Anaerococcus sp. TaxID=293428 RepID=UPI0025CF78D7|nr:metallophosphoesterase [uncultured Anaerococcus sp.]